VARACIDFARGNRALYDAMFSRASTLRFAADDTPAQLSTPFSELREAVSAVAHDRDLDTLGEVFWAALTVENSESPEIRRTRHYPVSASAASRP